MIKADGTEEDKEFPKKPTLKEMQEVVGGLIEPIKVKYEGRIATMVVNEDGKSSELTFNEKASNIYGGPIVGDVFILEGYQL